MVGGLNHGLRQDDPGRACGTEHKGAKGRIQKQHQPLCGGQRKSFHFESYQLGYKKLENKNGIFHIFPFTIVSGKVPGTQCVINACYE